MKYFEVLFFTITSFDERISHRVQILIRKVPGANRYKIKWAWRWPLIDRRVKTDEVEAANEIEAIDTYINRELKGCCKGIEVELHTEVKL